MEEVRGRGARRLVTSLSQLVMATRKHARAKLRRRQRNSKSASLLILLLLCLASSCRRRDGWPLKSAVDCCQQQAQSTF